MNDYANNEINFPRKLFLADTQVSEIQKAFANILSAKVKLSKTQISKIIQSGEYLGRFLGPLL